MATSGAQRKSNTTVRLEPELVERMERVRDPRQFPTQSAFIREAVRRMIREERRNRTRERLKAIAQDPDEMEYERQMAELGFEEWAQNVWGSDD